MQLVDTAFDAALAALADDGRVAGLVAEPAFAGALRMRLAQRGGAIVLLLVGEIGDMLPRLTAEQTLTINTAAAGGNAALLAAAG